MTREEEIVSRHWYKLLGLAAEAWACRKLSINEYGLLVDRQMQQFRMILAEAVHEAAKTPDNGKPERPEAKQERPAGWMPNAKGH